jgi:hexosaminidase
MIMMRHILIMLLSLVPLADLFSQAAPAIIPMPEQVVLVEGSFRIDSSIRIRYENLDTAWSVAGARCGELIQGALGKAVPVLPTGSSREPVALPEIYLGRDDQISNAEGYRLDISTRGIRILAGGAGGAFYGLQTLKQLFPADVYRADPVRRSQVVVPCLSIKDAPRFSYRGMHLDVGRHFFPVAFIKKYIDVLAAHKINVFHWHLTEDQGWRIEIKAFPALHEVGSCRSGTPQRNNEGGTFSTDGKKYCGYYTQAEIRDIVKYASDRFVTIIPEIEMPGHALAALAAYPNLGCTGGPYEVATGWGVFDDVFCAGNEQTFEFIDGVLKEICALFPGKYVHIGGDECPKTRWNACTKCKKRMLDLGLADAHALQSYFIGRVEQLLSLHGRQLIGWDEILEGGLTPGATVMSWRGIDGGIDAARQGHDVIMTPTTNCYFDYYQSDPEQEPHAIGGFLPLEMVYQYNPVPAQLTPAQAKHIVGVQGNLWTEYIPAVAKAWYMAYPRAVALSEVAWSAPERKSYPDFLGRLKTHFERLENAGVDYSRSIYQVRTQFSNGLLTLSSLEPAVRILYSLDGRPPHIPYRGAIQLKKTARVRAAAFAGNSPLGGAVDFDFTFHKASGKPYTMRHPSERYSGGEAHALTNGLSGGLKTWKNWIGVDDGPIDPVIDFGERIEWSMVRLNFVNSKRSWIYPPRSVTIFISDDGLNFRQVAKEAIDAEAMGGKGIEAVAFRTPKWKCRYLKLVVEHYGKIPEGMPGAGNAAWLFVDEIEVN